MNSAPLRLTLTNSEVGSRVDECIGEADNLFKIVRSRSGLDMSTDKHIDWQDISYRECYNC